MDEKLDEIKERVRSLTDPEVYWSGLIQIELDDLDYLFQIIEQQQEEIGKYKKS